MDRLLETLLRISVAYCLEIQEELVRPGTMNFGPRTSEKDSFAIMDRALELGINFFDTADVYGGDVGHGATEKIVGRWFAQGGGRRRGEEFQKRVAENRAKLGKYEALCKEQGEGPGTVALAWLLHNPVVTAPIIGPRRMEQLEDALRAAELTLDDETLNKLDEIWPGPGGEAPKAYAW